MSKAKATPPVPTMPDDHVHLSILGRITKCGKDLTGARGTASLRVTSVATEVTCPRCEAAWKRIAAIIEGR